MKKILLIAAIVCATLTAGVYVACSASALFGENLRGSGKIVTRTIDAPAFSGIEASRAVKVIISDNASDKITIEADDNVIDLVKVKTKDGELIVGIENKVRSISNINVTVTVPNNGKIRSLDASSAASITCAVALAADEFSMDASSAAKIAAAVKANKCTIGASSSAKIKAAIETKECSISASSASKIEASLTTSVCKIGASSAAKISLSGSARKCGTELTSASKLSAANFAVEEYNIGVASGSNASINCTKQLNASASSGAKIEYKGDCTAQISKSSGGSVSKE